MSTGSGVITSISLLFLIFKFYLYLFLERGEGSKKERERNINVWLLLEHPLLGTCPATQACALTGNRTYDPLVHRPALNPPSHTSQGPTFISDIVILDLFLGYPGKIYEFYLSSTEPVFGFANFLFSCFHFHCFLLYFFLLLALGLHYCSFFSFLRENLGYWC